MKKFLPLLFLWPWVPLAQAQMPAPLTHEQLVAQVLRQQQLNQAEGRRVAEKAPVVFLGRPVVSERYQDPTGRYYESVVYQVMAVLRGSALQPGTVTLNIPAFSPEQQPITPPPSDYEHVLQFQNKYYLPWGIYFCRPSSLPANPNPYRTSNPAPLTWYTPYAQFQPVSAQTMYTDGCRQETLITGLGYSFASEQQLRAFLQRVPHLNALAKPIQAYPRVRFVDERPEWQAYRKTHPPEPDDTMYILQF